MADEASDIAGKEQMSLVLRFVDKSFHIREDFIKFIHCKEGFYGKNLSDSILSTLADPGLDIYNCRGQGYDGAGAVAGRINGCSAHILRLNDKALYCHCSSHRLNLAISSACTVQSITTFKYFAWTNFRGRVKVKFKNPNIQLFQEC